MPQDGHVLLVAARISKVLVVHYGFVSDTPRLTIVHVLDDPKLAFDVFQRPESVGERASNRLKQVAAVRV